MAPKAAGLSARRVQTVKTAGLYLQVGSKGAKSWIYRYQLDGK
jgi:hypothetical protein